MSMLHDFLAYARQKLVKLIKTTQYFFKKILLMTSKSTRSLIFVKVTEAPVRR
jgi:hypothetical protein